MLLISKYRGWRVKQTVPI